MGNRAAKRYAKALFEMAKEQNNLDAIYQNMLLIKNTIQQNKVLKNILLDPTLGSKKKKHILNKIFQNHIQETTFKLLNILENKDRLNILTDIISSFENLYKQYKGIVKANVTSAIPLNDKLKENIYNKIKELTGSNEIELVEKTDPKIIGGFILNVDDLRYDASILSQLSKIKSKLVEN